MEDGGWRIEDSAVSAAILYLPSSILAFLPAFLILRRHQHRIICIDRRAGGEAGFVLVDVVLGDADVGGLLPVDVAVGEKDVLAAVFVVFRILIGAAGGEVGGDGEAGLDV